MVTAITIAKGYNISRIVIFGYVVDCAILAIVWRSVSRALDADCFFSLDFLRIICRKMFVEYHYIFVNTKRHSVSIQKTDWRRFLPNPFISKPFAIGVYQICGKWLLGK